MDRVKNGERSGTETPPLRIDPKWYVRHLEPLASLPLSVN